MMRPDTLPALVRCGACAAAVPSGQFCAICGEALAPPTPERRPAPTAPRSPDGSSTTVPQRPLVGQPAPPSPLERSVPAVPDTTPVRTPRRRGAYGVAALATLVAAVLTFGGPSSHTVTGELALYDFDLIGLRPGATCSGTGGYDDLRGGQQVVVADNSGATLATSNLEPGVFDGLQCVFDFTVDDVPTATFYRITLGRSTRGEMQYSYDELAADSWSVHLTIGD